MSTQHYFIRGKYYGSAERQPVYHHAERCNPTGLAFFCPFCGEVWALCPVEGQPFNSYNSPCEKHKRTDELGSSSLGRITRLEVPGSLLLPFDPEWNDALPRELLAREFLIHFNHQSENHLS